LSRFQRWETAHIAAHWDSSASGCRWQNSQAEILTRAPFLDNNDFMINVKFHLCITYFEKCLTEFFRPRFSCIRHTIPNFASRWTESIVLIVLVSMWFHCIILLNDNRGIGLCSEKFIASKSCWIEWNIQCLMAELSSFSELSFVAEELQGWIGCEKICLRQKNPFGVSMRRYFRVIGEA
jgi:hypothetical protein